MFLRVRSFVLVGFGLVSSFLPTWADRQVLFSSAFDSFSNKGRDAVTYKDNRLVAISITGAGRDQVSPEGFWNITDGTKVDLVEIPRLSFSQFDYGAGFLSYGHLTSRTRKLQKGSVFTTHGDFSHYDRLGRRAQIRYAASTSRGEGYLQFNASKVKDGRFNVVFAVRDTSFDQWQVSFRYGTAGTSVGRWVDNTTEENGTATATIWRVDEVTGEVAASSAFEFESVSLEGAGPLAVLAAKEPGIELGSGTYLLSVSLTGKNQRERITIDDLAVAAVEKGVSQGGEDNDGDNDEPAELTDEEILAQGLVSWRKPDGDGITCAECHGPAGYDIAVFDFDQADLRRATEPHLTDEDADAIFAMIELHRKRYPVAGGLKDPETFRPFQPGHGEVLGGADATPIARDAVFSNYLQQYFLYAQKRIATVEDAIAVRDELVSLDISRVSTGITFNNWSRATSRQGHVKGGKIFEWLPAVGQQIPEEHLEEFRALEDAYIAQPSNENFWALFHTYDRWAVGDPHNAAPVKNKLWLKMAKEQLKSNLVFQHDQLLKSQGQDGFVTGQQVPRPFADQEEEDSNLSFFWDVADVARIVRKTPIEEHPLRNQESLDFSEEGSLTIHVNQFRLTWFWLGWTMDPGLYFSGPSNSTKSGEYMIAQLWYDQMRSHQVFFNLVHAIKRGYQEGLWDQSPGQKAPQHFVSYKRYFLRYGKYRKGNDAIGFPGSAAAYKFQLANTVRIYALLHQNDIQQKGVVYGNKKEKFINHADYLLRDVLEWADPENKLENDQIIDSLISTISAHPQG